LLQAMPEKEKEQQLRLQAEEGGVTLLGRGGGDHMLEEEEEQEKEGELRHNTAGSRERHRARERESARASEQVRDRERESNSSRAGGRESSGSGMTAAWRGGGQEEDEEAARRLARRHEDRALRCYSCALQLLPEAADCEQRALCLYMRALILERRCSGKCLTHSHTETHTHSQRQKEIYEDNNLTYVTPRPQQRAEHRAQHLCSGGAPCCRR
jgi:hypothetical protein